MIFKGGRGMPRAQCRSVQCVWILYLGKLPGDEDAEWYSPPAERRCNPPWFGRGLDADDVWTIDVYQELRNM